MGASNVSHETKHHHEEDSFYAAAGFATAVGLLVITVALIVMFVMELYMRKMRADDRASTKTSELKNLKQTGPVFTEADMLGNRNEP